MAAPQLKLFREHVKPTKRARFVCEEILPDGFHCAECHAAAQAPLIATTRTGHLGCCCKSYATLNLEGLLTIPAPGMKPERPHKDLIEAFHR